MNERIKQLAEQARAYADQQWLEAGYPSFENYYEVFADDYNQKFAELIVRECAGICFSEAKGHNMAFGEHCGIIIKEHFGVDE